MKNMNRSMGNRYGYFFECKKDEKNSHSKSNFMLDFYFVYNLWIIEDCGLFTALVQKHLNLFSRHSKLSALFMPQIAFL